MALMVTASFVVLASAPARADAALADEPAPDYGVFDGVAVRDPTEKMDAELSERIARSDGPFRVTVFVSDREAVNPLLFDEGLPLIGGVEIPGLPAVREMTLDSGQIKALAENPGVYRVLTYYPVQYDRPEVDPDLQIPDFKAAPPEPEDYDVDIVHGAEDAWMMGYDGTDVTIAVIDTGFDMAHPDLLGQQARYNGGPYDGWPISYDDAAAEAWGNGEIGGWVSDTSEWTWDDGFGYAYFDGYDFYIDGLTDVLGVPVTSQSGEYHIGWHTDANLAYIMDSPVGVLVVDSVVPYYYDTVYVDVDCDFDFTDEKACVMGDETSYYDCYDSGTGLFDWSAWNAGDGYPDLSGGMVYWISDGVYALPGSIYYGDWWVPGSGEAVAFVGEFFLGESHGTMTASAALGTGASMWGMLTGMAPGAKLITIPMTGGVVYPWLFAELGADGVAGTGDEANICSNSYGWSDTAIWAGYDLYDMYTGYISRFYGGNTLWAWSTGNGGPGYGTAHTVTDFSSIHVGAGTTMQYRYWLGYEQDYDNTKWGDVVPFSNSGPGRNGKLNAEIVASGAYSLEPMPLNNWDAFGSIGDGYVHFQIGSGTSHATPTVAGGAALGYSAFYNWYGYYPDYDYAKAALMATADDMHFDPFKQGAGWLNASGFTRLMGAMYDGYGVAGSLLFSGWNEPAITKAALYPGYVYGNRYETSPNFLLPGEVDDTHVVETINYDIANPVDFNVTSKILLKTGSDLIELQTADSGDVFLDVTGYVPASTDLLKVTMFMPFEEFDPETDYMSNAQYWLELHDWLDLDTDGVMNTSSLNWELSRYTVDGENCNYNQVMIKDPMDRTSDGLIVRVRAYDGAAGLNISVQMDYYELQTFPWITFMPWGGTEWTTGLDVSLGISSAFDWVVRVEVPLDAPVGTYGAAIYVDYGSRVQSIPVVINVPAADYEFEFGGPSYFDTPYNNDFSGLADKGWRFEVGDWRMYWSMPSDWISYNAQLVTTVEWTELPTDVNVHVLASVWSGWDQFWEPLAPDMAMEPIASSDEDYMGAGTFGIGTNTGEAREVLTADLGPYIDNTGPAPFAILTRCPVMAGHSAQDTLYGFTTLIELNGYDPTDVWLDAPQPGAIPLTGVYEGGWYDITVTDAVDVKGGGEGPYELFDYGSQAIYQDTLTGDFVADLADAWYTLGIWVEDSHSLMVSVEEDWGCPDIDLALWYDADMDYVADLTEPYWYVGAYGSSETLELPDPEDGLYLIKVLGYDVTGDPGYFYLTVLMGVPGYIEVTDYETLAGSGTHEFNISYSVPERVGVFVGWATIGFLGADDSISIPFVVVVTDVGEPSIDNLSPADGSAIPTTDLVVSFYVNDHANFYSGWASWDFYVYLDGIWEMQWYASVDDANVTIAWHYPLTQGEHYLEIYARDIYWNWVYEYAEFSVNSVFEEFWAEFADPGTGTAIPDSSTVNLTEVLVRGYTDPYSDVSITTEWDSYYVESDSDGYYEESALALQEGLNIVTIETVNDAGVHASVVKMIESDTHCRLWVEDVGSPTAAASVDITGWTDEDATLLIDGVPVSVNPDGTFSDTFALSEGDNTFLVEATDGVGNTASAEVSVVLDTTAPAAVISSPDDQDVVTEASVTVTGTVDDPAAEVWVNGVSAADGAGGFSAVIALSEGDNTVTVVAEDALGNSASQSIVVTYEPPVYVTPDELQDLVDGLQDQIDDLVTDDEVLQSLIDALQDDLDALQADLDGQVGDLNESLLQEIADLQEQIDALEDQVQQDVDDVNTRVDDADAFADLLMYMSVGLFLVAIVLLVVVWFMLSRKKGGSEPAPPPED
ncbi:MAG: S8 family serine peptidase [Candidatus Thermoplasmatota archaeon]